MDSTNDEARRRAERGEGSGTVVWAREQRRGKGRRGRQWISPAGNLYCSVLLRPLCAPADAPQAAFVAALATGEAVDRHLPGGRARFKWPNDVLVGERKIAGILLESSMAVVAGGAPRLGWLVAGIGVNVASHPERVMYPATSLRAEGATDAPLETLLETLASRLSGWVSRWEEEGFAPVRGAWLERAARFGETISVRLDEGTLSGVFRDLDVDGALLLECGETVRRITAGDVFFG